MLARKKVTVVILGRSLSIKLPKLRLFRKKVSSEPEWSWQAAPSPAQATSVSPARTRTRHHHRYLTMEQVTNIQSWLHHLPKPGDVSQLELVEEYLADLEELSPPTSQPQHCQSIHTDIF